jgi:hypothetical protein
MLAQVVPIILLPATLASPFLNTGSIVLITDFGVQKLLPR